MSAMRELIVVERETVPEQGRAMLYERRVHGMLQDDGSFRLLACCGKRFPIKNQGNMQEQTEKHRKEAA